MKALLLFCAMLLTSRLDAIPVELVAGQRIVAISHYSRNRLRSPIASLAQGLPVTYETAEEIVALRPVACSVADSLAQIRRIAALVGSPSEAYGIEAQWLSVRERRAPLIAIHGRHAG